MNDFTTSRRLFVGGVLAAASFYIASVGSGALKACHPGEHDDLVDLQPLIRIGDAYLDSMAESGELSSTLYEELLDDRDVGSTEIAGTIQRHLLTLVSQTQLEFMHGETVSCDGWVLAKSEVRLCATAAIGVRRSNVTSLKIAGKFNREAPRPAD